MENFLKQIEAKNAEEKMICVGLDIDPERFPEFLKSKGGDSKLELRRKEGELIDFLTKIVVSTGDLVCAFKVNRGFYDAIGPHGYNALHFIIGFITERYPDVPVIMDAKRGDIGNSNKKYYKTDVEKLPGINAVTLNPYTGKDDSLDVFISQENLGCIILCRTSNRGAKDFQDVVLENGDPFYLHVAKTVSEEWNNKRNCCLVVGATYPEELKMVRSAVGKDMPILVPGVGAQGGSLKEVLENNGGGLVIINSSRGIIFASDGPDFADVAREKVEEMNKIVALYSKN